MQNSIRPMSTQDTRPLIERLREGCIINPKRWSGDPGEPSLVNEAGTDSLLEEAADEIERLSEIINRAREGDGNEAYNLGRFVATRVVEKQDEEIERLRAELDRANDPTPCSSCSGDEGHESSGPAGWMPAPCTCSPAAKAAYWENEANRAFHEAGRLMDELDRAREEARREALHEVLAYVRAQDDEMRGTGYPPAMRVVYCDAITQRVRKLMASPEPVAGKGEAAEATEGNQQ